LFLNSEDYSGIFRLSKASVCSETRLGFFAYPGSGDFFIGGLIKSRAASISLLRLAAAAASVAMILAALGLSTL